MTYKVFSFLLMLFCGTGISYAQKLSSPFEDGNFLGNVMKITKVDLLEKKKAETVQLDSMLKMISVFDRSGNILAAFTFMPAPQKVNHQLVLHLKQVYIPGPAAGGSIQSVIVKSPDKSGVIHYDKTGKVSVIDSYKPNGDLMATVYYKYDKNNHNIEAIYRNAAKNVTLDRKYRYNKEGDMIESDDYHDMQLTSRTFYVYESFDKSGNWTKRIATTHFEMGFPETTRITKRQIDYYK